MRDRKRVEFWQVGISLIAFSMVLMAVVGHQSGFDVKMRSFIYKGLRHLELPALALREGINRALVLSRDKGMFLEKIDSLQKENVALRMELNRVKEFCGSEGYEASPYLAAEGVNFLNATVIYRHPGWWWRYLTIDKGRDDGLKRGMPVLSGENVVGRVSIVEDATAVVELVTSPDLRIPVIVEDTRDIGVLSGDGKGNMSLFYMPRKAPLQRGMKIATAFAVGNFYPGLLVGTVDGPEEDFVEGDFVTYKVKPDIDFSRLRRVRILEVR